MYICIYIYVCVCEMMRMALRRVSWLIFLMFFFCFFVWRWGVLWGYGI